MSTDPFPPPNPSANWFRVVVWLMPTCLFLTTGIAINWVASKVGGSAGAWFLGWLGANLAATYGLGILDHRLGGPSSPSERDVFSADVTAFVGAQVLVIPAVLLVVGVVRFLIGV